MTKLILDDVPGLSKYNVLYYAIVIITT